MLGIVGIVALLTVLALSLFITRLATMALTLTGLSREAARFQARSAFTGTGFTTSEAEKVVNHPVRRRIIMLLMVLRSAGLVSIVLSLILTFVGTGAEGRRTERLLWIVGGVIVLWLIARWRWIERGLNRSIAWALRRWTRLDVGDYAAILNLSGEYGVIESEVESGEWLEDRRLRELDLASEGVAVLGIYRDDGTYVGVPTGDAAHRDAVQEQDRELAEQDQRERRHKRQRQVRQS